MSDTHIEHITSLSEAQATAVRALEETCRSHHPCPAFPWKDYTDVWLLWSEDSSAPAGTCALSGTAAPSGACALPDRYRLAAVLAAIASPDEVECIAMTAPELRRKGFFTELLDAATDFFGDTDLVFPAKSDDAETRLALEAAGAEKLSTEYRMEKKLTAGTEEASSSPAKDPGILKEHGVRSEQASRAGSAGLTMAVDDGEDGARTYTFYVSDTAEPAVYAGLCRTLQEGTAACFYDFEIIEALRGKGLGQAALQLVLEHLRAAGTHKVFLHVSGDNLPAVRLYEKAGFAVTEAMDYYLY
ncbi:MAG: GNAT family N-acetyltransferase [Clostridium sp.]|nr:GNAT family N-acetyltransferase [Clostridium sp.]